ncbi:MAG: DUF5658 family protein [Fimbriimonadales bacterium]|nr:DUF5658 family protein [Fimbriimonadales bacterium]
MRHKETWGLILLVVADSLSTYWLITQGYATEFNPIMNWFIQLSWSAFFAVKFLALGIAVGLAEWYRRRNPLFVRRWLQFGVVAYLTLWLGGALVSSWWIR